MNRVHCGLVLFLGLAALAFAGQTAQCDTMNSGNFAWKYEMADDPVTEDLDSLAGYDWAIEAGDFSVSDGKLTFASSGGYNALRSGPVVSGNVWNNISVATGYTIEASVKAAAGSTITNGVPANGVVNIWGDAAPSGDKTASCNLLIGATSVSWDLYSGGWQSLKSWNGLDNSSDFHTYRIAQTPGAATFSLWRDDVLLGSGLATGYTTTGANLSVNQRGDAASGAAEIDYLRMTSGAYAPVPEPSVLVLAASGLAGLLAYAWKKRK